MEYCFIAGFDYVIVPPKQPKVCFGSGIVRECLPSGGPALNSFMRRNTGETRDYPGPCDFDTGKSLIKTFANKKGYSLLASKSSRMPKDTFKGKIPPIGTYEIEPESIFKKAFKPFGSGTERNTVTDLAGTPAPSTYSRKKVSSQKICMCFGTNKFNYPSVQIVCSPINLAVCEKCLKTPTGDYWRRNSTDQVYCRPCMKEELSVLKSCIKRNLALNRKLVELGKFVRYRYCGFYHDHAGTTAAVQFMSKKDLKYKIRNEDYLASFGY